VNDIHSSGSIGADGAREPWLRPELMAPWWEIVLVLAVMLGPFVYGSTHFALESRSSDFISHMVSNRGFLRQGALEAGLLAVFFSYLRWRGWAVADFKIRIDWKGVLIAPFLAVGAGLANVVTAVTLKVSVAWMAPHPNGLVSALLTGAPHIPGHSVEIAWVLIFALSIINAFLEELVFMGYAFHQFAARRGPLFALMCMVFLRMLLHTYKGPLDMLGIAAFSFVYGLAYCYLRRLWPLILAHAGTDLIAFAALKIFFGR
jgi:membrane protease YdiL (CAAX protease family)